MKKSTESSTSSIAGLIRNQSGVSSISGSPACRQFGRTVSESSETSSQYSRRTISESSDVDFMADKHRRRSSSHNRLLLILTTVFALFVLALMSLVVALWMNMEDLKSRLNDQMNSRDTDYGHMCLPCADMKLGPFPEDNRRLRSLTRRVRLGVEECCATTAEQNTLILDLVRYFFLSLSKISCSFFHIKVASWNSIFFSFNYIYIYVALKNI